MKLTDANRRTANEHLTRLCFIYQFERNERGQRKREKRNNFVGNKMGHERTEKRPNKIKIEMMRRTAATMVCSTTTTLHATHTTITSPPAVGSLN